MRVQIQHIGELASVGIPEIPIPSDIDLSKLKTEEQPVTLRIGKVGAVSRNASPTGKPRKYGLSFYQKLVQEIAEKRPEGAWGHLISPEKRAEHYAPPAIRWLGAVIDENGVVWGKCIPQTSEAQNHFRIAEATKAQVATSLLGDVTFVGEEGVDIKLENIDLAHPPRVGVQDAISYVYVSEMEGSMPPTVESLTTELDNATQRVSELEKQIASLQTDATQAQAVRALVSEYADAFVRMEINLSASGNDLVKVVSEMIAKLQEFQIQNFNRAAEHVVSEMVQLDILRPIVLRELNLVAPNASKTLVAEMVQRLPNVEAVKTRVSEIMKQTHIEAIAKAIVAEKAGPSAIVGGTTKKDWRDEYVENARQIAKEMGALK
jgi:hypothetical protein